MVMKLMKHLVGSMWRVSILEESLLDVCKAMACMQESPTVYVITKKRIAARRQGDDEVMDEIDIRRHWH